MSSITYSTPFEFAAPTGSALNGSPSRTRLRLTRRGRAVIAVLVSLPLVLALIMLALNGGGATASAGATESATVTVQAGESLWSLASSIAPSANPADVVADLLAINGLASASVQPGQVLILPERYAD